MKTLILLMSICLSFSSVGHTEELYSLNFSENAKALFERGTKTNADATSTENYVSAVGSFSIQFHYQVSVLNRSITCYHLDRGQIGWVDSTRIEMQKLQIPSDYSCVTQLNIQKDS